MQLRVLDSYSPSQLLRSPDEKPCLQYLWCHWLSLKAFWVTRSRVVSVLDSGPGFKSQPRLCRVSLRQTVHTHRASVHQAAKLVAALLRAVACSSCSYPCNVASARVTAGLAESNGSLLPGLWLTSPAGWLPRTRIGSRTLRSVIEYGLPLSFLLSGNCFLATIYRWDLAVRNAALVCMWLAVLQSCLQCCRLQCFDTVGWASGRASGL